MKKIIPLFCFCLAFLLGCESDDICTDQVITPRLIVRLHDKEQPNLKKTAQNLLVIGKNNSRAIQLETTDSIAVPLKMLSSETTFLLVKDAKINDSGEVISGETTELKISYTPEQIFSGKGCGYKTIFKNISAEITPSGWVNSVKTIFNTLENEKQATIRLYF